MTPEEGVKALAARFYRVTTPAEHFAIVDSPRFAAQLVWLTRNRPDLMGELRAAVRISWKRIYPQGALLHAAARENAKRAAGRQGKLL